MIAWLYIHPAEKAAGFMISIMKRNTNVLRMLLLSVSWLHTIHALCSEIFVLPF